MNMISRNLWILRSKFMGLKKIGSRSCICKPLQIDNSKSISIGERVFIGHNSWLIGAEKSSDKGLIIGDNTTIGHFAHIVASKEVIISCDVLLADKVFISDCSHNYKDIDVSIQNQGVSFLKSVRIGEGSWLGENVCVCGASIGKHCVIGANSVVTTDIPDFCIAVGCPAKIVKKYDELTGSWKRI